MRLKGKCAVVTGGSRGMGRHIAATLASAGARVAILARPSEALEKTAMDIGPGALAIGCDIADPQSVRDAFATVEKAFRGLDILVNNAGMSIPGVTEHYGDDEILQQIHVNYTGAVFTCRSAIPLLRKAAEPHIVNISSEGVKAPYAMLSIYTSSKAALENYSIALRKELRADGIRVTILRSGMVGGSEMSRNWQDDDARQGFLARTKEWGNLYETGTVPAPPGAMADALLDILTMRRELNIDLIEIRPLVR